MAYKPSKRGWEAKPEPMLELDTSPVSEPVPVTRHPLPINNEVPPNFQKHQANSRVLYLQIRNRSDRVLKWEPNKVQVELAQYKGLLS